MRLNWLNWLLTKNLKKRREMHLRTFFQDRISFQKSDKLSFILVQLVSNTDFDFFEMRNSQSHLSNSFTNFANLWALALNITPFLKVAFPSWVSFLPTLQAIDKVWNVLSRCWNEKRKTCPFSMEMSIPSSPFFSIFLISQNGNINSFLYWNIGPLKQIKCCDKNTVP